MKKISRIALLALAGLAWLQAAAAEATWGTDFTKALETAKAENKQILVNFTGSDWCGFCIKLDKEVFQTKEFGDYAAKHLVLVKADFPRKTPLPKAQQDANEALKKKYAEKFEGYPTVVLINAEGKKLGQTVGYNPGSGPKAYLKELADISK